MKKLLSLLAFSALTLSANAVEIKQMITVFETQKDLTDLTTLTVDGNFCKVNITQGTDKTTTVSGKLEAMTEHEDYNIKVDQSGSTATVVVGVPAEDFSSFVGEINIALAKGVTLTINNKAGYVDLKNVSGSDINITTLSGKITIDGFDGGTLNIDTKNGTLTAKNLDGTVSANSSKGDQSYTNVKGTLTFESPDGNVDVTDAQGTINGKTTAGSQTYLNFDGTLNLKGSSGALKISNAIGIFNIKTLTSVINLFETKGEFHIETTKGQVIGNKGITLRESSDFTTTEGKVNIRLTNSPDELTFNLAAESPNASLIVKGVSKKKKLQQGKGPIVITGRSKTGSQVFNY